MLFLRSVQLDRSDEHIYQRPAQPGEWTVPGSFALWDLTPQSSAGPGAQAFRHGFVGTESFGHTTLVVTATIDEVALEAIRQRVIQHLMERYGAPDADAASPIAEEEIRFTMELCDHPPGTLIAVERSFGPQGVEEQYRVFKPDASAHEQIKLWGCEAD